ncbi:DUF4861 domain-containing protein [Belliella sp. DSM 111904]|uniref:DUF4861 domain-containing protein n=1 Tax=Belliella filtrata TaxID=2923435 RepID=A0ABS9UW86_9BACT|nr:DUF4861 domain-containing protein [Belliella filtrata]MCH7408408.1 DUF4861 domain-containing protein [Belliella filtrata]
MKKRSILYALLFCLTACGTQNDDVSDAFMALKVTNPSDALRVDQLIWIEKSQIQDNLNVVNDKGFTAYIGNIELASQYVREGEQQGLAILIPEIQGKETLSVSVTYDGEREEGRFYPKRTQAELSHKFGGYFENRKYIGGEFQNVKELHVPQEHTDHSWYIRYEGPGWESDKVGYRFYLDWRNGVDVFGKRVTEPVLQNVGMDDFDSYHDLHDWGMDVLKVGKSLGIGSIATWEENQARRVDVTDSLYAAVTNDGAIFSSVLTKYYGWDVASGKTDLTSNLSIHAGSRLSEQRLYSSEAIPTIATGLIKDKLAEVIQSRDDKAYSYLATYGKQSLNDDNLGIAIFYKTSQKLTVTEDEHSHVVVLKPEANQVKYYFAAAWELEQEGIKTLEDFQSYLDQVVEELSNPLVVEVNK